MKLYRFHFFSHCSTLSGSEPNEREFSGWPVGDKATRQPELKQQDHTEDVKKQTYGIDASSRHALLLSSRDRFRLPAQNLTCSSSA